MKSSIEDYRKGAMGAILDEYEKALGEFLALLKDVNQANYERIMDTETNDPDCRSIKTITYHVINAGYGYSYYIRLAENQDVERIYEPVDLISEVETKANNMFDYVVSTSDSIKGNLNDEKTWTNLSFESPWSDVYNLEQILEHAIVHILRHRRQIEKFIIMQQH